jgi:hypothetical protein
VVTPYDPTDHRDVLLQLVAAVDYLAATTRPGLTVWDAVDDAVRAWVTAPFDAAAGGSPWDDPDPLRSALGDLLATSAPAGSPGGAPLGETLSAALASWVAQAADDVNDGHRFAPCW